MAGGADSSLILAGNEQTAAMKWQVLQEDGTCDEKQFHQCDITAVNELFDEYADTLEKRILQMQRALSQASDAKTIPKSGFATVDLFCQAIKALPQARFIACLAQFTDTTYALTYGGALGIAFLSGDASVNII